MNTATGPFCWLSHPTPKTLQEHISQEVAVAKKVEADTEADFDFAIPDTFYKATKHTTDYLVFFNFLYGDTATVPPGNNTLGIKDEFAGFNFARWLAGVIEKRKRTND